MAEVRTQRDLPLLAQLILHGSSKDQKSKESKGLAHDSGLGAECSKCGPECSGFELHYWRKVCKNCGCRPQQHNIILNKTIHQGIVKDLFTGKDMKATPTGSEDDLREKEIRKHTPSNEGKKVDMVIPTIRIESMVLEPAKRPFQQSNEIIERAPLESSKNKVPQERTKGKIDPLISSPSVQEQREKPTESRKDVQQDITKASPVSKFAPDIVRDSNTVKGTVDSGILVGSNEEEKVFGVPVPPQRKESFGEVERQRKLLNQLPPQDFDPKFCSTLNRKQKQAMNKMSDIKKQAASKGKLAGSEKNQICRGCNTEIGPGEKAVCSNYEKQAVYWHQHCFKCKSCNETIVDYIYFWHENEIFCGRHFAEKYRPRCAGCDELIYADKYTKAECQSWHLEHFTCFKCDRSLTDTNYISHKGQPHCLTCYHFNIASKCASCGLPMQVGEERITYGNMHWHAYRECFFCRGCNKDLVDVGFLLSDDKLFCSKRCSRK